VCRYNWHSAGSRGWPFRTLDYKYIFQIQHTETILSNSARELLWLEIANMLIAALNNKFIVSFIIIFGTLSFPIRTTEAHHIIIISITVSDISISRHTFVHLPHVPYHTRLFPLLSARVPASSTSYLRAPHLY